MLSALGDFQLALSAATFLQEADENEKYSVAELRRFRCFEQTAIVSYSWPFSQSKGSAPSLSPKKIGLSLSQPEKDLHDGVIRLRNKAIAHSDVELMNFAAATHDMSDLVGKPHFAPLAEFDEGLFFSEWLDQQKFINLISKALDSLCKKLHELAQADPTALNLKIHFPNQN